MGAALRQSMILAFRPHPGGPRTAIGPEGEAFVFKIFNIFFTRRTNGVAFYFVESLFIFAL